MDTQRFYENVIKNINSEVDERHVLALLSKKGKSIQRMPYSEIKREVTRAISEVEQYGAAKCEELAKARGL